MENLMNAAGLATGRALMAAIPVVIGAAVAEPLLLGALVATGIFATGILLGVGIVWAARTMR